MSVMPKTVEDRPVPATVSKPLIDSAARCVRSRRTIEVMTTKKKRTLSAARIKKDAQMLPPDLRDATIAMIDGLAEIQAFMRETKSSLSENDRLRLAAFLIELTEDITRIQAKLTASKVHYVDDWAESTVRAVQRM